MKRKIKPNLNQVTIGADPEFGVLQGGQIVEASDVLSEDEFCDGECGGDCGCDQETIDNGDCDCSTDCECSYHTTFGLDGSHSVFELRPKPSLNPMLVYESVHGALKTAQRMIGKGFTWQAGSLVASARDIAKDNGGFPIGGHVHFGHESFRNMPSNTLNLVSVILDYYLGLPVVSVEDEVRDMERTCDYGQWGDIRGQRHGFEYRTLPSWLVSPAMTLAVLSLAKVIGENIVTPAQRSRLLKAIDSKPQPKRDNMKAIRLAAFEARELCRALPGYKKYAKFIEPMFKLGEKGKLWYPEGGMQAAWRVSKVTAKEKRELIKAAAEEAKAAERIRIRMEREAREQAAANAIKHEQELALRRARAQQQREDARRMAAVGFDGSNLLRIGEGS